MKNNEKIQVITHTDLDGVVSYLVLCWLYGRKLDVIGTTPKKLEQDYQKLISSEKTWDKLFFLDLDVSKIGNQIDDKKTVIFDHHKTNIFHFNHALVQIHDKTSCSKLLYDILIKRSSTKLTSNQKLLIALADDVDSNSKTTPLSEQLNIVYHSLSNKFVSFVEDYYDGFKPFDKFKTNTISLYYKHKKEYIKELNPFFGQMDFEEQTNIKVGAVFCNNYVQECCEWLFDTYDVDIAIAVMLEQQRIAVRRNSKNSSIDVSKFVQRIANGGGHAAAAGGNITEEFVEFTKLLKPLN